MTQSIVASENRNGNVYFFFFTADADVWQYATLPCDESALLLCKACDELESILQTERG